YEDGDFISKRRYGRHETYAIPYNGEEVMLYWANRDQYYVKTGDRFKAYRFKVGDCSVAFELRNVTPEQNGNTGKKRYFVLAHEAPPTWNEGEKALAVGFEYRPLTEAEGAIFQDMVDEMYNQFVDIVAKGRHMSVDEVKKLADGRVYTGTRAKELGLVDEIGNYYDAVMIAADMAGIKGKPVIKEYGKKSALEALLSGVRSMVSTLMDPAFGARLPENPGTGMTAPAGQNFSHPSYFPDYLPDKVALSILYP
ncbi:MAG: S49 family peptidase, partial [Firmicutes bacterium]|nr:S49 family peptidase [Bacillota bacterium]